MTGTSLKIILLFAAIQLLYACGGGSNGFNGSSVSEQNYNGPGSKWDISLKGNGTFHIDHRPDISSAIDYTVDGTYVRQNSGFVTLIVTGGTGADAPTVGSEAWALEVPGYAFMLQPADDDQLVPMIKSGECPTSNYDANWVMVKKDRTGGDADANNPARDFAGQFHFDFASGVPSIPVKKALSAGFPTTTVGGIDPGTVTCQDGIMNIPGAIMYLTSNGGVIVHSDSGTPADESDDSIIFGFSQKTITNINEFDGQYAGLVFDATLPNGSKTIPVSLNCTGGNCTGTLVTDVNTGATGTTPNDTATINLSGLINDVGGTAMNGFITGTITNSEGGIGNMICMADLNAIGNGKKIVSCIGQSPGNINDMFNLLFVSN